jgi:nitrilase
LIRRWPPIAAGVSAFDRLLVRPAAFTEKDNQVPNQPFKVAVVQAAPAFLNLEKAVEKTISLMDEAGRQGVQLIAFPETWIPGYPWYVWLGTPAYSIHFSAQYFNNSLVAGSDFDKAIAAAAKRNKLHAIIGVSERSGGSLYMGQWHYAADGQVLSRRKKLKPTHVERSVFGEGDGSDIVVNDTEIGRIGALCCWEHLQPLSKYAMFSQHEQIHVASWPAYSVYTDRTYALSPELSIAANQIYAAEGQCFVLSSCAVISEEIHQSLCDTDERKELIKVGGGYSQIFGPDGGPLADYLDPTEEGLIVAEIDLDKIAFCKAVADPVGHYSRPDVFRLMFNRQPTSQVMSFDEGMKISSPSDNEAVVFDEEPKKGQ